MTKKDLSRRDFTKLTTAALGGMVAGTMAGCGGGGDADGGAADGAGDGDTPAAPKHDVALLLEEPHVCRGLNACSGKGAGGDNACAGQGACATAEKHDCATTNACKGQGGCGEYPGQNSCKEQGKCHVPLSDEKWAKVREAFDKAYAEANDGKAPGAAPAKG